MNLASNLKHKLKFYKKTSIVNELGQETPIFEFHKEIWGNVQVASAQMKSVFANTSYEQFTHKVTIRSGLIELENSMEFELDNMRFEVLYYEPCYNDKGAQILYAKAVIE